MPRAPFTEADVIAQYRKLGKPVPADLQPPPRPRLPSLQVRYPEEAAMQHLWTVAEQAGWIPDMHFFPHAKTRGLWAEFVRGTTVLRVLVYREEDAISGDQRLWLDALHQTGKFEVFTCPTTDLSAILRRLKEEPSCLSCPSATIVPPCP